ncbi:CHAT domain-containing protein [Amylostereum chailletii]|nr:CHAT domain-containing protein [Amylostereum chailletii]
MEGLPDLLNTSNELAGPVAGEEIEERSNTLSSMPEDHPNYTRECNALADLYAGRHRFSGFTEVTDDLDHAIYLRRHVLESPTLAALPAGSPLLIQIKLPLAQDLTSRYRTKKSPGNADEAVKLFREIKDYGGPSYTETVIGLAECIIDTIIDGVLDKTTADVDEALALLAEARTISSESQVYDDPTLPFRILNFLGMGRRARFRTTRDTSDLEQAIEHFRVAIREVPTTAAPVSVCQCHIHLADALDAKYSISKDVSLLAEAVSLYRTIIIPVLRTTHQDISRPMDTLAQMLTALSLHHPEDSDAFETSLLAWRSVALLPKGSLHTRYNAARTWVRLAEAHTHPSVLDAYRHSLRLLAGTPLVGTELTQPILLLACDMEIAADAAACALRAGNARLAVQFLEHARGNMWDRARYEARPRSAAQSVLFTGDPHIASDSINAEQEPQFIAPTLDFTALRGPAVVLNAASSSCDAVIVLPSDTLLHVPLSRISVDALRSYHERGSLASGLHGFKRATRPVASSHSPDALSTMWNGIVYPVLRSLGLDTRSPPPTKSRIWWCPTGAFVGLPLHAARPPSGGPDALDLVISSYTPTLSTLLELEAHRTSALPFSPSSSVPAPPLLLAISQPDAPGHRPLPYARAEMQRIRAAVPPDQLVVLEGPAGTLAAVRGHLTLPNRRPRWLHFACHATQDARLAYSSAFVLHDGMLELSELMRLLRPRADSGPGSPSNSGAELAGRSPTPPTAELACLLACHTAATQSRTSGADDALNLAFGLHSAGFRGVVGSMWEIADVDGPAVSGAVYGAIFGEGGERESDARAEKAAEGVNRAARQIRDAGAGPERWATFIHIGV